MQEKKLGHLGSMGGMTQQIETVADVPADYVLVSDSQDIRATLESIGQLNRLAEVGCLFAKVGDGEYESVFACSRSVPWLTAQVWRLL